MDDDHKVLALVRDMMWRVEAFQRQGHRDKADAVFLTALAAAEARGMEKAAQWHDEQAAFFQRAAMGDKTSGAARAVIQHRLFATHIRDLFQPASKEVDKQ